MVMLSDINQMRVGSLLVRLKGFREFFLSTITSGLHSCKASMQQYPEYLNVLGKDSLGGLTLPS